MTFLAQRGHFPKYSGLDWLDGGLPSQAIPWPIPNNLSSHYRLGDEHEAFEQEIRDYGRSKPWLWPSRPHFFFTDIHADADAFLKSLVASGGVEKTGPADHDFRLTEIGRGATFVLGGDCFDKGPDNLRLLRALRNLRDMGADLHILAGNHDIRTYIGIACAGRRDPRYAHLFVRMGQKTVPLFKEIFDTYLAGGRPRRKLGDDEVRRRLFPGEDWYKRFPEAARGIVPPARIEKEIVRIREKTVQFEERCRSLGMSLGGVALALDEARRLFLHPEGEFFWYFNQMKMSYRAGSFLMVHAGIDDRVAAILRQDGVDGLNAHFQKAMSKDLFDLYNGSLGNVFRTKYRPIDHPFTQAGLRDAHAAGIYAVIHGHRRLTAGQQLTLRNGMMNFECDASVDAGTRRLEGLRGVGGAVTVIHPNARIIGVSTDYPLIKVFDSTRFWNLTTIV